MSDQKTFAFIYDNPSPNLAVLWPNWYENDKEYLDTHYDVLKEYNITNLGWSAWLSNNQPYLVLSKKIIEPTKWDVVDTSDGATIVTHPTRKSRKK